MMKDEHRTLRKRQREQRVGDRVNREVALGLGGGLCGRVGQVGEKVQRADWRGRG